MSGRDYQLHNYNQQPYFIDADGNKVGETHFRELYSKITPRLNILSGVDEQEIEEKVKAATGAHDGEIKKLHGELEASQDNAKKALKLAGEFMLELQEMKARLDALSKSDGQLKGKPRKGKRTTRK